MSGRRKKRIKNTLRGILLAATLCFIWGNSLLSRENSAAFSGRFVELLTPVFSSLSMEGPDEHVIRKLAHFTEYAVLGLELAALFFTNRGRSLKSVGYSALCALAVASADETIQIFSHRGAMVTDVLLDFAGALTGILLLRLLTIRR